MTSMSWGVEVQSARPTRTRMNRSWARRPAPRAGGTRRRRTPRRWAAIHTRPWKSAGVSGGRRPG